MLTEFKTWLRIHCDSDKTAETYYEQIKRFVNKYGEPITQENLDKYFLTLKDEYEKSTFNGFCCALQKYCVFAKVGFVIVKQRSVDKKLNEYLTEEELFNEVIPCYPTIFERDIEKKILITKFLFYQGLRASELVNLRREDFDFKEGTIHIKNTKTDRDRKTPLVKPVLIQSLKNYFATEPEMKNAFNISRDGLKEIFNTLNASLKYKFRINPKLLRHSCGTHLLNVELYPINDVANWLGHTKLETTAIYATRNFHDLLKFAKTKTKSLDR